MAFPLKIVKEKFYLCALPAKLELPRTHLGERREATGYLISKSGGKTRDIDEAMSIELEVAYGNGYGGEQVRYFEPYAKVLINGMVCQIEDEERAMQFLFEHPLPRKKLSQEQRQIVHSMFGGRCAYCGKQIALADMQVDHIDAYSRGGADDDSNYFPACSVCNRVKASYSIEQFRSHIRRCGEIHRNRKVKIMADSDKMAIAYGIDNADGEVTFFFEKGDK